MFGSTLMAMYGSTALPGAAEKCWECPKARCPTCVRVLVNMKERESDWVDVRKRGGQSLVVRARESEMYNWW